MAVEYSIIIGYGIISFVLIFASVSFEKDKKEFFPIRVLLFFFGLFLLLKIPGALVHVIDANDVVNQGVFNATQVNALQRGNATVLTTIVRLPYIIMVFSFFWFFFWWWGRRWAKETMQDFNRLGKGMDGTIWNSKSWKKKGGKWK